MQIRLLSGQERALAEDLWDYCFEKRGTPFFDWYFSKYCRTGNILGAFAQEKLAGMVHLNPYALLMNGETIPVSYLVGVAVAPEFRRQGLFRDMLAESFSELNRRGQPLTILKPTAAGLYTRYGFACCYYRLNYSLPFDGLLKLPYSGKYEFAAVRDSDWPCLQAVYSGFTAGYNGQVRRSETQWLNMLGESAHKGAGRAVLARAGGQARGYLFYTLSEDCFRVAEMAYLDNAAKLALLSFAAQHFSQCANFSWLAPADDLTFLEFARDNHYPVYQPFMIGRIINPPEAVARLKLPSPPSAVNIALTDGIIAENNAVFKLSGAHGAARLDRTEEAPRVRLGIGALAQLCFGAHSPDSLLAAGCLETADQAALACLRAVFAVKTNYINEYF